MVTRVTKRVKSYVFKDKNIVIIFCPRISSCPNFCSTFRKYDKQGYDIVCLNPNFYKPEDLDKILREELKRRNELKNRLGF